MAAAIRYTGLAGAAGGIGGNFFITPLASPIRPLIATQIGKTRDYRKLESTGNPLVAVRCRGSRPGGVKSYCSVFYAIVLSGLKPCTPGIGLTMRYSTQCYPPR